jgi:hypothetical protein
MIRGVNTLGEGPVLRCVVDDQDFDLVRLEEVKTDTADDFPDCRLGEVRDDEDQQAGLAGHHRRSAGTTPLSTPGRWSDRRRTR